MPPLRMRRCVRAQLTIGRPACLRSSHKHSRWPRRFPRPGNPSTWTICRARSHPHQRRRRRRQWPHPLSPPSRGEREVTRRAHVPVCRVLILSAHEACVRAPIGNGNFRFLGALLTLGASSSVRTFDATRVTFLWGSLPTVVRACAQFGCACTPQARGRAVPVATPGRPPQQHPAPD